MRYILLIAVFWCSTACADIPMEKAVKAIIGEAENDNMLALACTLRSRGSLRGVYGLRSPRVVKQLYSLKTYNKAVYAWNLSTDVKECSFIGEANHWQSLADMKKPSEWRDKCEMTYFSGKTYYFKCNR